MAQVLFWRLVSVDLHVGSQFRSFLIKNLVNPPSVSPPGLAEADENCKRFMDRCMPEAFKKVSDERPEA